MSNHAQISLMSISQLLEKRFSIPKYQRGYRWGEQEIHEILAR